MSHYNMVHQPTSIPKAMKRAVGRVARQRAEVIDATVLLASRAREIFYDNSRSYQSYKMQVQGSHQTYYIHHTFQLRSSHPQSIRHQLQSRSYTSFTRGMKIWTLPESRPHASGSFIRRRTKAQSYIHSWGVRKQDSEGERRANRSKVGAEEGLVQKAELSKNITFANYQIHQAAVFTLHQPMKVTKTTSIVESLLFERRVMPTNANNYFRPIYQLRRNHG